MNYSNIICPDDIQIIGLRLIEPEFKIVQLYHKSQRIMLCGDPKKHNEHYHSMILKKYLKENHIEFNEFSPDIRFPMRVVPRAKKEGIYEVVGMGYSGINLSEREFKLPYGSCRDYEMKTNKEFEQLLIEKFKKDSLFWEELEKLVQTELLVYN